jgi:hypothetical protein
MSAWIFVIGAGRTVRYTDERGLFDLEILQCERWFLLSSVRIGPLCVEVFFFLECRFYFILFYLFVVLLLLLG